MRPGRSLTRVCVGVCVCKTHPSRIPIANGGGGSRQAFIRTQLREKGGKRERRETLTTILLLKESKDQTWPDQPPRRVSNESNAKPGATSSKYKSWRQIPPTHAQLRGSRFPSELAHGRPKGTKRSACCETSARGGGRENRIPCTLFSQPLSAGDGRSKGVVESSSSPSAPRLMGHVVL